MRRLGAFIDGRNHEGAGGDGTVIVDPSTNQPIAEVVRSTSADVDAAVRSAHGAFEEWRSASVRQRRDVLRRIADLVRRDQESLARLESANAGKPIRAARGEIAAVVATFDFYAGAVDKAHGQTIPVNAPGTMLTFREPVGVCALVIPWNFPLLILGWKVAPALAMGNVIVAKPAEVTPLSALALAELAIEAGLPPGVFNVVPGQGSLAGEALTTHPAVRKISFTGSTEVGTRVMQRAAAGIKNVSLELGGKSASLVFADADLEACVESSVWAVYDNAGQDCCSRSRILVERSVFEEFTEAFVARTQELRVAATADDTTDMGPLITPAHLARVEEYLEVGDAEGATRVCGGEHTGSTGNYLTPAAYVDVDPSMRIMQEEIFGPVVGIMPFDTESDAVALANDSIYGLSGSIWTRDVSRALRVARGVETGMLSINSSSSAHIEAPFGGVKQSGIGREQGLAALDHYSEYKSVFIAES